MRAGLAQRGARSVKGRPAADFEGDRRSLTLPWTAAPTMLRSFGPLVASGQN